MKSTWRQRQPRFKTCSCCWNPMASVPTGPSGGPLGSQTFFRSVGIGETERLAGAIFVHYPGLADDSPVKLEKLDGKNRVKRGPMRNWASELGLSE